MRFKARDIAKILNAAIEGDQDIEISGISKIEEGKPGTLSFLANPQYEKYIYDTTASIVLVSNDFTPSQKISSTLIRVKDPYEAFATLLGLYNKQKHNKAGIEDHSFVDESAETGEGVYIGAFAYIGKNVKIGNNVKIYPHVYIGDNSAIKDDVILHSGVKVYDNCEIGNNCILHSGVIIGGDGFGFASRSDNNYKKVPQVGNVIIGNYVEIGSNTTIDRATIGSTIISDGVKLDNLIQIAHNVEIGDNTVIAAQTGISGSTKIGKNCMIAGQVGIIGHLRIADNVKIAAQSGVARSIEEKGATVQGSPAYTYNQYQRSYVVFRSLPEMKKMIEIMEKELEELKSQISGHSKK